MSSIIIYIEFYCFSVIPTPLVLFLVKYCTLGWHEGIDVPVDIYVLYITQLGFYTHSFYATAMMDDVRKDYVIMYVHHTVSCLLIGFSLAVRYGQMHGCVIHLF